MLLKKPLTLAFLLNFAFLILCFGIGGFHYGSLDDFFMSAIVTGAYGGEFDAHTLFVNGIYAYFLKPFYAVFPSVGWYSIFQFASVFASFSILAYYLLRQVGGKLGLALAAFALACLTPEFYLQIGFTQCAAALTSAGMLLLYFGNKDRNFSSLTLAVFFLLAGGVFRREGFLLGMPFLFLIIGFSIIKDRKIFLPVIAAVFVFFIGYLGLQSFNNGLFSDKEYSYYKNYQWPRATLGDGEYYDRDWVYDELEERGMSGADFRLLKSWTFHDTRVFALDSLKSFVDVVQRNRYEQNMAKLPGALLIAMANSFLKTNAWCWGGLCLLLFFFAPKKASLCAWGTLSIIALCLGFLLLQNRVVHHVEMGIWLYAVFSTVTFFERECESAALVEKSLPLLVTAMALGCLVLGLTTQRNEETDRLFFGATKMPAEWSDFLEYAGEHSDDVFLLGFHQYKALATFHTPIYKSIAPHSWGNIIPMGYWNVNLPGMKREMELRGVKNPMGDIIRDNVYVLDESCNYHLESYYKRHYHQDVVVDTLQKFGTLSLLKYRVLTEATDE